MTVKVKIVELAETSTRPTDGSGVVTERMHVPVDEELFQAIGSGSRWSDVVRVGNMLWVTGQLGWNRHTGELVEGLEKQAEQALKNLENALNRAGATLSDVVQTRIYLTDHDHYARYEPIYNQYFPTKQPARVSVVVAELIHHALFDIEAVAVIDSGGS
jgi:2-iminobutanoate/2-iminopropanoate deaminase